MIRRLRGLLDRLRIGDEGVWILQLEGGLVTVPAGMVTHFWPKPAGWIYVRRQADVDAVHRRLIAATKGSPQ